MPADVGHDPVPRGPLRHAIRAARARSSRRMHAAYSEERSVIREPIRPRFRLYVAGESPNSLRARRRLEALCRKHAPGGYEIEVLDVMADSQQALQDGVLITPFLIQLEPRPARLAGDLADEAGVLAALHLALV